MREEVGPAGFPRRVSGPVPTLLANICPVLRKPLPPRVSRMPALHRASQIVLITQRD